MENLIAYRTGRCLQISNLVILRASECKQNKSNLRIHPLAEMKSKIDKPLIKVSKTLRQFLTLIKRILLSMIPIEAIHHLHSKI
jgi:hypothetical protein